MTIKDKNVFDVVCAYAERAQKGFDKYGTTTERTDIDLMGWLQHLQEELMDATIYIQRIKCELGQTGSSESTVQNSEVPTSEGNSVQFNGNIDSYTKATQQTAIYPQAGTGADIELQYLALGLTSEAGEVAGKIKKLIRDNKLDVGNLAYELGDCFYYLCRLCEAIGYSASDVLDINMTKLLKRKANGTLSGNGDNR